MIGFDEGSPIKKQIGKRIEVKKVNIKILITDIHHQLVMDFYLCISNSYLICAAFFVRHYTLLVYVDIK